MKSLTRWWSEFDRARQGLARFQALPAVHRQIVFFAEDASARVHFEPLLSQLTGPLQRTVSYLTSSSNDPILQAPPAGVHPFFVGAGTARTYLFQALEAPLVVMTMPDLETYFLKRSRVASVHYCYVFHSMVSSHMIYTRTAFWHYDSVLCVGPHHVAELAAAELRYGLKPRQLVEGGYARLDTLLATRHPAPGDDPQVLLAPSWGPHGVLETCGEEVVRQLLEANLRVVVRPHPRTVANHPDKIQKLRQTFTQDRRFSLETDVASADSLLASHVMLSDWSGAALEFAFGMERPVLFLDVPRKVNNPDYQDLGLEPIEVSLREQLGRLVPVNDLSGLGAAARELGAQPGVWRGRLAKLRTRTIFNVGRFGEVGAAHLNALAPPC